MTCFLARDDEMRNIEDALYLSGDTGKTMWEVSRQVNIYLFAQNEWAYETVEYLFRYPSPASFCLP